MSLSTRLSNAAVMHLNHLGLPVRDERRSQQFYSAYFGFDPATAQEYEDGTVIIRNADGFDLALHPVGHVEPSPAFLHAGFNAGRPAEVHTLMKRMEVMASLSWNGTMKQPTWRSNASTQTATGSRCIGSRGAPSDAKSAAGFLSENAPDRPASCGISPQTQDRTKVPPRGGSLSSPCRRRTIGCAPPDMRQMSKFAAGFRLSVPLAPHGGATGRHRSRVGS